MSNILEQIDNFQLDNIFEPISQKYQRLTGKNCFFLARVMCDAEIIFYFVIIVLCFNDLKRFFDSMMIVFIMSLFAYKRKHSIRILEISSEKQLKNGMKNSNRISAYFLRLYTLAAAIIVIFIITSSWSILIKDPLYFRIVIIWGINFQLQHIEECFASCTPLPPGTSKVKQWLKNMKESLSNVFAPEPVCVPVKNYTNTNKYWFLGWSFYPKKQQ